VTVLLCGYFSCHSQRFSVNISLDLHGYFPGHSLRFSGSIWSSGAYLSTELTSLKVFHYLVLLCICLALCGLLALFFFVIFMFLQVYSNFFVIISGKSSCPIFVSLHIIFVMYELNPDCYLSMVVKLELFATTSSDVHTRCVMLLSHLIPWATFPTHELRFFLIYYCHIHAYG
jgi:hypothetical protein